MKKYHQQKVLWSFRQYDHKLFQGLRMLGFDVDFSFSTYEIINKLSQYKYSFLLLETQSLLINSWLILRYIEYFEPHELQVVLPSHSQNFIFASQRRRVIYQAVMPKGVAIHKLSWFLKRCEKKRRNPLIDSCCNH